jgi:cytochrome c553
MAVIQNNEHLLKAALTAAKDRVLLCGNCHGKNGNSVRDYIPNLAGDNNRPAHSSMAIIVRNMDKQQLQYVAAYVASMP